MKFPLISVLVCLSASPTFAQTTLDLDSPAWQTHCSPGDTVTVQAGVARIDASENTFAHLSRPLGIDGVRASCAVRAGLGVSWCTSLFLYWGPGNWCQIGIDSPQGGRVYAVEMADRGGAELSLGKCDFNAWQYVAIELGRDCVRYYSSADGASWRLLRSAERPAEWAGAPKRLIVGKGYGRGDSTYPKPDLDNDYSDRGGTTTSFIRDVRVAKTAPALARATPAEARLWRSGLRDEAGDRILAMKGDPTFARVQGLFPKMRFSREAVGVKDHPFEFVVEPDGSVLFGNDVNDPKAARASFEIGDPPRRMGGPGLPVAKSAAGSAPDVQLTASQSGLKLREYVWAWSEDMSPDKESWVYANLFVKNATRRAVQVPVKLVLRPQTDGVPDLTWDLQIPAGETRLVTAKAPYAVAGRGARKVGPDEESAVSTAAAMEWVKVLGRGVVPVVPDPRVSTMWGKSLTYNFVDVDKVGGVYEPHDGSGFYEEVYGYSAALFCNALDLWGFHDDSRRYLDSLLTFVHRDGLFDVNNGLPDMGALLYASAQHALLAGDTAWLKRNAPTLSRVADWLIEHRRPSMRLVDGRRPVTYGLIRYRAYCDYSLPTVSYLGNCCSAIGLEWIAKAYAGAGLTADAARMSKAGAAYRSDILASMKMAVFERNGVTMLPMEPDTRRLLRDNRYTGGDYYGLIAPIVLETGFLPAESPYTKLIVDLMEKRKGLILRMSRFNGGIDHAYTYGYWMNLLERDRIRPLLVGFYGMMAYGMSPDTFAAVECTDIRTGDNTATTPHLYSGTQQLRLLRMMLVREAGDTLWLAQATPRAWLEDGKEVSIAKAPTLFGPVTFRIRSSASRGRIVATVRTPVSPELRIVRLRLRCPEGYRLASVTVDGREVAAVNETVSLKPSPGLRRIVARVRTVRE